VDRILPSQVVSDNLRQATVPEHLAAPRSVPGPPCRSPTAVPTPLDRSSGPVD